jgi:hypothetical protein
VVLPTPPLPPTKIHLREVWKEKKEKEGEKEERKEEEGRDENEKEIEFVCRENKKQNILGQ